MTRVGEAEAARAVEAVWRIESARIVATLARTTGDLGLAEDLAQEALLEALEQWPAVGTPRNPGAWLTAVAKRRVIDGWRRRERLDDRYRAIAHDLAETREEDWEPIGDDVLRLVMTACHPALSRESQVALTLRVVSGLTTEEIARLLLVPVPTVQARITRAKKALAGVPFEVPDPGEWSARLGGVLGVVYLVFTEGYSATSGAEWMRPDLAAEALRLGRVLAGLVPREPEVHGLVALMELQASRFAARRGPDGEPVLLEDQDRSRWDRAQIGRGTAALRRAEALGGGRGPYELQAAIAEQHAIAPSVATTDWGRIALLYAALEALAANPVVTLNRAIAVAMADGPEAGLAIVDALAATGALRGSHLPPSVRGELLARAGRRDEAAAALAEAAALATNDRTRAVLLAKAALR
ncbi:RNA polymerase sigma factor [Amnibacterium kyonggiense]|uniref:RNA polymerase sigma factor n=1 Tax=Amnibacterium kyonggiense TaxID=595671 RepID=A0A4V3EA97_9MICO|nr:sigma-70 family RNA polymerase sigma factor [Amnibacterium kyonggiense]TDS75578.1 RNA polymerase sigma factor (sigma-70 family) [Amnibacterium kyonggiense]